MPLTDEEKGRVRYHMGYPALTSNASLAMGVPVFTQTNFVLETNMVKILESAVETVRRILRVMDDIELKLIDAQDRLAAIQLEELHLREDETDKLEGEYRRWGYRLADTLAAPIYPYARRYQMTGGNVVTNIPVSH